MENKKLCDVCNKSISKSNWTKHINTKNHRDRAQTTPKHPVSRAQIFPRGSITRFSSSRHERRRERRKINKQMKRLSLGAALIEILEQPLKIGQRKEEYRIAYKFYKELLNLHKVKELNDSDISKRESEFIKTTNFFPREKYIKQVKLNGYRFAQ